MRTLRHFLGDRRATSAVEFALVAGPLLLIVLGTMEFGRIYWAQEVLGDTVIAGARCMALPQTACTKNNVYDSAATVTYVRGLAADKGVAVSAAEVAINRAATCSGISGFSSVSISYTYSSAMPSFITALVLGPALSAKACFPNQA